MLQKPAEYRPADEPNGEFLVCFFIIIADRGQGHLPLTFITGQTVKEPGDMVIEFLVDLLDREGILNNIQAGEITTTNPI